MARQFLQKLHADFTISYDPETDVATQFEVIGMPSSYQFDRKGDLVKIRVGFFLENMAACQAEIVELLKQEPETGN
ncbi:hypothetical protein [Shewanella atlantica]|uniref:hypothetical protein n=1 Tax=Shewanella atlantica TaxID=271099 RepID=UPI001FEC3B49|nr:hypothetical protein [Shewanella atlantica]